MRATYFFGFSGGTSMTHGHVLIATTGDAFFTISIFIVCSSGRPGGRLWRAFVAPPLPQVLDHHVDEPRLQRALLLGVLLVLHRALSSSS